jgi:hypothetical protein
MTWCISKVITTSHVWWLRGYNVCQSSTVFFFNGALQAVWCCPQRFSAVLPYFPHPCVNRYNPLLMSWQLALKARTQTSRGSFKSQLLQTYLRLWVCDTTQQEKAQAHQKRAVFCAAGPHCCGSFTAEWVASGDSSAGERTWPRGPQASFAPKETIVRDNCQYLGVHSGPHLPPFHEHKHMHMHMLRLKLISPGV